MSKSSDDPYVDRKHGLLVQNNCDLGVISSCATTERSTPGLSGTWIAMRLALKTAK